MLVSPMPRPSAQIHDAVCAGVAPSAAAAWKTITTELVKPTSTATKPATTADEDETTDGRIVLDDQHARAAHRARLSRTSGGSPATRRDLCTTGRPSSAKA
jgi:hypothetical protein